jgi:hypothetical protein
MSVLSFVQLCRNEISSLWILTRPALYIERNTKERSRKHFCGGKEVLHVLSVCLALFIRHETCLRYIVICGLSVLTIFVQIISKTARLSEKSCWMQNMCFNCLYTFV